MSIHKPELPKAPQQVTNASGHKLLLRNLRIEDYDDMLEIMQLVYSNIGDGIWPKSDIETLLNIFPEGQICIEDNGKVVACALSIVIDYNKFGDNHTYAQITGNYKFTTHDLKNGNVLYGIDIFVHPKFQGLRLGRRLYDARKELCEHLNLKAIVAGGRIPGYAQYADKLTPREYIELVKNKEISDPILSFQLSNDFHVKKVLTNYLPGDKESKAYATLLEWNNIYYTEKPSPIIGGPKEFVRLGVVQWQMRNVPSLQALLENVEFFIDAVSAYKADFVLFPEFFNAPLMGLFNEDTAAKAIRKLASYTEELRNKFVEYAVAYNTNIIAGSMPLYTDGELYNVSYLCRRDGTWDVQYKLHITPDEKNHWGVQGGNKLHVFETDVCKIGILICYDVEFPELSRILADQGMQILFVPFLTDTQNGYHRVSKCAQARAIENECYVAIAGNVGNLPRVKNMDLNYAQSAVFSPSDFAFPNNAIVAQATPNAEMTIIADVDLSLLKELHTAGSVRNLKDRRRDLYEVRWLKKQTGSNGTA
ncbi:MAG: bifunctional GNAT family N-acetyltransferase/carbon-nitrogen hydrolase family protein [Cytophagales bacterium]|nr:bifunctional GNAT family N-acetyltransferase/carbon-nitrogen hydrolase family protein [Bernardetiaceae bacterium]MDW8210583.1 bifunctional GNAT family N-acetyltransferase/carbon-nitrogen hydrolase family protein [Cytophagales bacterium]